MSHAAASRITIVAPMRPGASSGNDVTAARWKLHLEHLGHHVTLTTVDERATSDDDIAAGADILVALHARRCAGAVAASRRHAPSRAVVVALTGTDLYVDLPDNEAARASIETADRLVVLQEAAVERLRGMDPALAAKSHLVYQSVERPRPERRPPVAGFVVFVLAHLRDVKDPLLAARAGRLMDAKSQVEIIHAGHAHDGDWERRALLEQHENHRYRWLGELDRPAALDQLSRATVLACTSRVEGGANVVTEAVALGVPVIGTAIDGTVGLLGEGYPGLVPVGDAAALAGWLTELESDRRLLDDLTQRVNTRSWMVEPETERVAWADLLAHLPAPGPLT